MKRSWMVAAAVAALLGCSAGIQAKETTGAATPPPATTKPAAGPTDKPTDVRRPASDRLSPVQGKPFLDATRMDELLVFATAQPWAVKDAETQVLVEKILTARKNMLLAEMDRVAAFQKVTQTARTGDAEALKTVTAELRATSDKVRQAGTAIGEDLNALMARLRQIKPVPPPPEPKAVPEETPKAK